MFRTRQKRIIAVLLCLALFTAVLAVPASAAGVAWLNSWLIDPYTTSVWNYQVWRIYNHDFPLKSILEYGEEVINLGTALYSGNPHLALESARDVVLKMVQNYMGFDNGPVYYASSVPNNALPAQAYIVVDYATLADFKATMDAAGLAVVNRSVVFNVSGTGSVTYWCIQVVPDSSSPFYQEVGMTTCYLSDSSGKLLLARATDKDRNDYSSGTTSGDTIIYNAGDTFNTTDIHYAGDTYNNQTINNNQVYDHSTNQWIDVGDVVYDYGTKTYYTYNTTNNYYTYEYNYYIDYTSITYIGSSAEYSTYEIYYQLPDGRSSADLTAEDLEQLALTYDVINYGVSTDDGRLRYLNHFDGAIEDVSYWSNYTSFDWASGASITYMETANFGGALYLDENAHQFTVTLPSNLAASDFTVMFRYYHSANESTSPVNEMQISSGSNTLFTITTGNHTTLSNVPTGQWTEVGLIRDGTILYCYVNGILSTTVGLSATLGDTLTFNFLAAQTYRQFDELRVYDYALYEGGVDYTPVTVPVDTNAVLVLPDESYPIPDAYWYFNTDGNLLRYQNFTNGTSFSTAYSWNAYNTSFYDSYAFMRGTYINYTINSSYLTLHQYTNTNSNTQFVSDDGSDNFSCSTFAIPLGAINNSYKYLNISDNVRYTFSVLLSDGSQYSLTFLYPGSNSSYGTASSARESNINGVLDLYYFNIYNSYQSATSFRAIVLIPRQDVNIVYMELVKGRTPNTGHQYVTEIYNSLDLTGPTIAVRSQIPVRSWRIGSVRPSLPYRGDVWMMVENSRITSLQIYTGYMWTEIDGRIWTGSKWSSLTYYDIMTQQDYGDIIGTTDNIYIQSSTGFYEFMVNQIREILEALNTIIDKIGNVTGSTSDTDLDFTLDGINISVGEISYSQQGSLWSIYDLLYDIIFYDFPSSGIFGIFPFIGSILSDFSDAFGFGGDGIIESDDESSFTVFEFFEGDVW